MRRTPARHGYRLELGAAVFRTLGAFVELADAVPLFWQPGGNDGQLRLGALFKPAQLLGFMGAYVRRGFTDYARVFEPSPGAMWLGEARLQLLVFAIVARAWRAYDRAADGATLIHDGTSMLAEVHFAL